MEIRLQKVLAAAGLGSRRKCEEFISQGRVTVDDVVVDELGARVDPTAQVIRVDGVRIAHAQGKAVFALHKPLGVVTTMSDPHGRPCVGDLVAQQLVGGDEGTGGVHGSLPGGRRRPILTDHRRRCAGHAPVVAG